MKPLSRILFYGGSFALILTFGFVHSTSNSYAFAGTFRFPWLLAFSALVTILAYGLTVPDAGRPARGARLTFVASLASLAAISVAQLLLGTSLLPRSVLFGATITVPLLGAATSAIAGMGQRRRAARDRVLAVVSDTEADRLRVDLANGLERELTLVETITNQSAASNLLAAVQDNDVTILVYGREAAANDAFIDQAALLHARGIRIRPLLGFYEEWVGKLPVSELRRSALLFDISDVHRSTYRRTVRGMDIAIAITLLPALLFVVPIVFLANLVGNKGPLFFRQSRVGRDGELFDILKLRTMTPGTSSSEWTAEGDARITKFGHILRTSHLDELPQLINILRGDISVVGPRPEQPHYVDQLKQSIPFYDLRHVAQPGLTGWAQINYRYGNTEFDALEKLQFEFYYLRHQSLWLDLRIIARTLQSVVGRKGK